MSGEKDDMAMEVELTGEASKSSEMDVAESERNVMAPGTTASVTCSLHPLVIMNVSEHWTRERAQDSSVQRGTTPTFYAAVPIKRCCFSYRCTNWQAERPQCRDYELL